MIHASKTRAPSSILDSVAKQLEVCQHFPTVASVETHLHDPLRWLNAQSTDVKLVWRDRDSSELTAGLGEAVRLKVGRDDDIGDIIQRCRETLSGVQGLRFFGGVSFDGQDAWDHFGAGRFFVPRCLMDGEGRLDVVVMSRDDCELALEQLAALCWEFDLQDAALPSPTGIHYSPTRDGWQSNVDEALTFIRSEVLEKVVLARKTTLEFESAVNPIALTSRMIDATYDCFNFCFQFAPGQAFLGATPERLFRREGNRLLSQVIAGTRPRGASAGEDQRLAYDLLTSDKDQLEHDIVRKSIRQKLHKFVDHLDVDDHASVLRLACKQHLCSDVSGTLKQDVNEAELLERLHPTPAVGGYPTENALPEIARLEPFNRGWYAAPIGWIGVNAADFVVGIRSGLVNNHRLSLFSGAGIVKGSDPDQEWDEVDNKIRDFLDILD